MSADDMSAAGFVPAAHLTEIDGRPYLEVKWRLAWLRAALPGASIYSELLSDDGERAVFKVSVTTMNAAPLGSSVTVAAHGSHRGGDDYVERAETRALGRALAALGFGTQFVGGGEFAGDADAAAADDAGGVRPVDAPVRPATRPKPAGGSASVREVLDAGRAAGLEVADVGKLARRLFGKSRLTELAGDQRAAVAAAIANGER